MSATTTKAGWTPLLLWICLTTTIGTTVPVGFFLGVLNAPAVLIKQWCQDILASEYDSDISDGQLEVLWAAIVSIFLVGGICGSCFSAYFSDRYGRKGSLVISSVLLLVAGILFTFCLSAKSLEMLMVGRFLGGIASALIFTAQPMYLLELAPLSLSGSVGVFTCIGVTGGILISQLASLPQLLGTEELWPYALSCYALLVLVCLLPMCCCFPESPRWLFLLKGDADGGEQALRRLRGQQAAEEELLEMAATLKAKDTETKQTKGLWQVLSDGQLLLPLVLVCSFQATQQLCGINAIFYYSIAIFKEAGFAEDTANWLNLGIGGFNLCVALLGPLLLYKFPRRPLMIASCGGCALALLAMAFGLYYISLVQWLSYACIAFILAFILCFQLGLGPIAYFIGSELLEVAPRPVAMSMGSLFNWIGNFLIGMCFPLLQGVIGSFAFLPCACVCIYCLLFTWRYLPETRGREAKEVMPLMSQGLRSKIK